MSFGVSSLLKLTASLLLAVGVYWSGLQGSFFFDDGPNILKKPGIAMLSLSPEAFMDLWRAGGAGPLGRPVAQMSFALNHYFSGFNPFFFKLTNLTIHLVNGVLVMLLAMALFRGHPETGKLAARWALLVMLLWLLHPLQLLAILHVTQRMTSLSALFLLAALVCHIYARRTDVTKSNLPLLVIGWLLFWPLSIYSKESGVLFPLFALSWECLIRRRQYGRLDRFGEVFSATVALVVAIVVIYVLSPFGQWLWRGYEFRVFSLGERLLTEARVIFFYLELILFPRFEQFGLFHDDFMLSTGLFTPWTTLASLCGLAGLLWLIWLVRCSMPLVSFGVAWFLIGHLVESTALPLELVHEHRNYLPLLGISIAVVAFFSQILRLFPSRAGLGLLLFASVVAYLGFVTALRSHQFADELRRTQLEAQHHRQSARAQNDAGRVLAGYAAADGPHSPTYGLARAHYELAIELDPNIKISLLALLHLDCSVGKMPEPRRVDDLEWRLQHTAMAPGDRSVVYALRSLLIDGSLCLSRSQADTLFSAAAGNSTADFGVRAMFHSWHADYLWLAKRDLAAAIRAMDASLSLAPGQSSNLLKRAQLHLLAGEMEVAFDILRRLDNSLLSAEERLTRLELINSLNSEMTK